MVDAEGKELEGEAEGNLVIKDSWPGKCEPFGGILSGLSKRILQLIRERHFTGDGARRDKDGYYWITGRVDDVLNVSGHRLGTAEVESALVAHEAVAEAAVVGMPHEIKGQGICSFVTLQQAQRNGRAPCRADSVGKKGVRPCGNTRCLTLGTYLYPKTRSGKSCAVF